MPAITPADVRTAIGQFLAAQNQKREKKAKPPHTAINEWLTEELLPKLDKLSVCTHTSKHIHSKSQGDNALFSERMPLLDGLIATQSLPPAYQNLFEIVRDAALAPLGEFLALPVHPDNSIPLAALIQSNHPALACAFHADSDKSEQLRQHLAEALQPDWSHPRSDGRNKQILWPDSEQDYICLVPLYPATLTHYVYQTVQEARFSENSKAARQAQYDGKSFDTAYTDYPNMAVVHLGGANPQNVSHLNSKQSGRHYLLPALPPEPPTHSLLGRRTASLFTDQLISDEIHNDWKQVILYLPNNVDTRNLRKDILARLSETVLRQAAELRSRPDGWSDDYALNTDEKYWLDRQYDGQQASADIADTVSKHFANWLNNWLKKNFPKHRHDIADAEFHEWRRTFREAVRFSLQPD